MTDMGRVDPSALHQQAQSAALEALLRGDDVDDVVAAVAPYDVRGRFTPDVAMLELAVDALDLANTPGSELLEYEGLREHYLPEVQFHGRTDQRHSQYAIYATGCLRGGLRPDLLNDAGWWHTRLWIYATYALIIYTRAAAERRATTPQAVAKAIVQRRREQGLT